MPKTFCPSCAATRHRQMPAPRAFEEKHPEIFDLGSSVELCSSCARVRECCLGTAVRIRAQLPRGERSRVGETGTIAARFPHAVGPIFQVKFSDGTRGLFVAAELEPDGD
jgi:hypothetical protein